MPRQSRTSAGGYAYHVMNRTWGQIELSAGAGVLCGVRGNGQGAMARSLATWPLAIPADWLEQVNRPQDEKELAALHRSRDRGQPFGDEQWVIRSARQLGLESTLRPLGRPKGSKRVVLEVG